MTAPREIGTHTLALWSAMADQAKDHAVSQAGYEGEGPLATVPSAADMEAIGRALEEAVAWIRAAEAWHLRCLLPCDRCGKHEAMPHQHRGWMGVHGGVERLCVPCLEGAGPDVFSGD